MRRAKLIGIILCIIIFCLNIETTKSKPVTEITQIKAKAEKSLPELSYLTKKPGDTSKFGQAIAVSDKYMAVGDTLANRVTIYFRQTDNSWLRIYEICPPKPLIGKSRASSFGYDLELGNNSLIIYYSINKDFWGNYVEKSKIKRQLYLVHLSERQATDSRKIKLHGKNLYDGGAKFLGKNITLVTQEKSTESKFNNYVYFVDSTTGKKLKRIKLPDFDYQGVGLHSLGIDSDGKNLVVLPLSLGSLKSKSLLVISEDGNISNMALPLPDADSPSTRNYFPQLYSDAIEITNKFFAISVKVPPAESYETIFWERTTKPKVINVIPSRGNINGEDNNILISYSHHSRLLDEKPDYIFLTFLPDDKTFSQIDIEWACTVEANKQYSSLPLGLVDKDNLILSAYGTVAIVPYANLTNLQTLYNPSCRSN